MREKPRLRKYYEEVVIKELSEKYGNPMAVPKLEKIVINCGLGGDARDRKTLESAIESLKEITGQKPKVTRAKKSVSAFHLRAGNPVGLKATIRRDRMFEFLDRLINVAIPRIRDFRGLNPNSFDGRGNYTVGVSEQFIFPEIDYEKVKEVIGMDITLVTTAKKDEDAMELLKRFGMPFRMEG
ncbi:MAG: 50S ribosomal protein L5 [candidate division WOR-3 bacterium]|nr:50S ribosomal protein L5 [candidate division WOR-3 bacterium]